MLRHAPALRARDNHAHGALCERVRWNTADASAQGGARGPFVEFQPAGGGSRLHRARYGNGDG